jgi:hypothetical protein
MGTSVILDVLGSMIIGGILLLTLFRMNDNATRNTYNFSGELTVQQNLVTTVELLEYDFRKIGYCEDPIKLPHPEADAILHADTSDIKFLTDLLITPYGSMDPEGDGNLDTLEYRLGPTSELSGTPNPNDRYLYRIVNNGTPRDVNLGVTIFKIRYYRDSLTASGSTTLAEILPNELPKDWVPGTPTGITALQIDIQVENTASYDAANNPFRQAFWRQIRLSSRNLKR